LASLTAYSAISRAFRRPVSEARGATRNVGNAAIAGTDRRDEAEDSSAGSGHRPAAAIGAIL
jgi:hypothetical protein